ncbi:hypothetical protein, partial [uncultured Duncaniella sp.]
KKSRAGARLGNSSIIFEIPRQASSPNGGPHSSSEEGIIARRITKDGKHSNPVIRSFIIFLRRVSHKEWSINLMPHSSFISRIRNLN